MITENNLLEVITLQKQKLLTMEMGQLREDLSKLPDLSTHALIISGIRRCGKSTLMTQMQRNKYPNALFVNFEDNRLCDFDKHDFNRLNKIIENNHYTELFFDEMQVVPEWERYARQKLDEGYKMMITGSNASLLSKELGTKLTGRHITKELFPFSFTEFCDYKKLLPSTEATTYYLQIGGFPEYVKQNHTEILTNLFDDILMRDVVLRHGVRDVKMLQRLSLFLISNVGNLLSANKLKKIFEFGATSTVTEYLSHLELSYLFFFVPKFSYSIKVQVINPRKVYSIDTGIITENSISFSHDNGAKLENVVFLSLRRNYNEIYYFSENNTECDFIVFNRGKLINCYQVCYELNDDNLDRELKGIFSALNFFNLKEGAIVTYNQTDIFERNGKVVKAIPAHQFLTS
jgi:predicted AAA+ superfamily ATPase